LGVGDAVEAGEGKEAEEKGFGFHGLKRGWVFRGFGRF
jgi:hypothetical protein